MSNIEPIIQFIRDDAEGNEVSEDTAATTLIAAIANYFGIPVKVWSLADLEGQVEDSLEGLHETHPERFAAIVNAASATGDWMGLSDCTDGDWQRVSEAIDEGIAAVAHGDAVAEATK